jgi:phage terminase small subunit
VTEKQKIFCDEYLIDCNATQAAIRAGYSGKSAYSIGEQNLKKLELQEYIQKKLAEKNDALVAKQDEVLQYLTSVIRSEDEKTKDRLTAAELLGKRYALFTEKITADATVNASPKFADIVTQLGGGGDDV